MPLTAAMLLALWRHCMPVGVVQTRLARTLINDHHHGGRDPYLRGSCGYPCPHHHRDCLAEVTVTGESLPSLTLSSMNPTASGPTRTSQTSSASRGIVTLTWTQTLTCTSRRCVGDSCRFGSHGRARTCIPTHSPPRTGRFGWSDGSYAFGASRDASGEGWNPSDGAGPGQGCGPPALRPGSDD